jgi:hypothetical protein
LFDAISAMFASTIAKFDFHRVSFLLVQMHLYVCRVRIANDEVAGSSP